MKINTNFSKSDLSNKEQIEYLQRRIIILSIMYYELNNSIVDDKEFDKVARLLVDIQSKYDDIENTQYGYCVYDFDGTTGFDLYDRLNKSDKKRLMCYAMYELKMNKVSEKGRKR